MDVSRYAELLKELREQQEQDAQLTGLNDRVLLIDGLNLFIRCFVAIPAMNEDGYHIGGMIGFLKSLGAVIRQYKPTRCIIVFDGKGGSARRKKLYPEYKGGRKFGFNVNRAEHMKQSDDAEQESMRLQFARLYEYLCQLPISVLSIDDVEADDVISYIANEILSESHIIITSSDKDFLHLVNERITVWSPIKKKLYDAPAVLNEYKLPSKNLLLARAFIGDGSDNINGVKGVGMKTLLKKIPILTEDVELSLREVIKNVQDQITNGDKSKMLQTIMDNIDVLERNCELMDLRRHDISGEIKMKIRNHVESSINELNRGTFRKMLSMDKSITALPEFNTWINNSFATLESFARNSR